MTPKNASRRRSGELSNIVTPTDVTSSQYRDCCSRVFPDSSPNYGRLMNRALDIIRTWTAPTNGYWCQLTYNPLNEYYDGPDYDFFQTKKFIDGVRRRHTDTISMIITKEIVATKHHVNVLCLVPHGTDYVRKYHNEVWDRKCKIHCQIVRKDEEKYVAHYILKESLYRHFHEYLDYYMYVSPIPSEADRPCVEHDWRKNDTPCEHCLTNMFLSGTFVEA